MFFNMDCFGIKKETRINLLLNKEKNQTKLEGWDGFMSFLRVLERKVGWLVLFNGVSTFFGLFNAELNFKQFSLV